MDFRRFASDVVYFLYLRMILKEKPCKSWLLVLTHDFERKTVQILAFGTAILYLGLDVPKVEPPGLEPTTLGL